MVGAKVLYAEVARDFKTGGGDITLAGSQGKEGRQVPTRIS